MQGRPATHLSRPTDHLCLAMTPWMPGSAASLRGEGAEGPQSRGCMAVGAWWLGMGGSGCSFQSGLLLVVATRRRRRDEWLAWHGMLLSCLHAPRLAQLPTSAQPLHHRHPHLCSSFSASPGGGVSPGRCQAS